MTVSAVVKGYVVVTLTLEPEGPATLSLNTFRKHSHEHTREIRTCCKLRSPSVCFRTCESGLKGTAHSAPDMRPWRDIAAMEVVSE